MMHLRQNSLLLGVLAICASLKTSDSPAQTPPNPLPPQTKSPVQTHHDSKDRSTEAGAESQIKRERLAFEERKLATKRYWSDCAAINRRFISDKSDVWFKGFRPGAVESTCREAAKRLRVLDKTNVDGQVLDHANRVIRGFENMGAIAKLKGEESLRTDAVGILNFIRIKSARPMAGAVADGGWIEMGPALTKGGKAVSTQGQSATTKIASDLSDSEEYTIRAMRESYKFELEPW